MTMTTMPPDAATGSLAKAPRSSAPAARAAVPDAPAFVPEARAGLIGSLTRTQQVAAGAIVAAALILSGVGLYLSFEHVAAYGYERLRFQSLGKARLFTVGVDVGILVLIAIDLLMAWLRRPIGWVRYPVWLLTGATIVLNAASASPTGEAGWTLTDYVAVGAHALVPLLFIVIVEIGKTAIGRVVAPEEAEEGPGIPGHRWFLAPVATYRLWRRMKLWELPTYRQAVEMEQDRAVYRVLLERKYGRRWRRLAPADMRLPLIMAPYGLTVAEALALPREQEEREALLAESKAAAKVAAEARAAERAAQAEIARLRTTGTVAAVRAEVSAATEQAAVTAQAELVAAKRAAEVAARAVETATEAEAEAESAAALKRAAEDRAAAAVTARRAAGIEKDEAEARRRAAVADEEAKASKARAALAVRSEAEALQAAAEAQEAAAVTRARAAEIERRAVEVEDEAQLGKRERAVRKVARMVLAEADGDANVLPLERISDTCNVSSTTASEYRREAAELIASGYRP
ncbi:DUF2637 domain-containing protein [Streptomyces lavendulae]|uniref:DUF2637 domain-containing protein n=1 Tax=Streptomyces lavendulae TaxID=1914 RepID=UPI0031E90C3B